MDTTIPPLPDYLRVAIGDRRRLSGVMNDSRLRLQPVEVIGEPYYSPLFQGWMVPVIRTDPESVAKEIVYGTPREYLVRVSALVN